MIRPLPGGIGGRGPEQAGFSGHQVRFPGPPPASRVAASCGASISSIVVTWTSIVSKSGWISSWLLIHTCFGTLTRAGNSPVALRLPAAETTRSEEHTSELQSLRHL